MTSTSVTATNMRDPDEAPDFSLAVVGIWGVNPWMKICHYDIQTLVHINTSLGFLRCDE